MIILFLNLSEINFFFFRPKRYKKIKYTETRQAKNFNEVMGL